MGIESGSYLNSLRSDWPLGTDLRSDADNHLRLIKATLKATFPGAGGQGFNTPIVASEAEINHLDGVDSNIQDQLDNRLTRSDPAYVGNFSGGAGYFSIDDVLVKPSSADRIGINTTSPQANLHVKGMGADRNGVVATFESEAGTLDPSVTLKNYNAGSPVSFGFQLLDSGALSFKTGLSDTNAGFEVAAIRTNGTVKGINIPEVLGKFDGDLSASPPYVATVNSHTPTLIRNAVGNYTITFTGYTSMQAFDLTCIDLTRNCILTVMNIAGGSVQFRVANSAGDPIDPAGGLLVKGWVF